ncbi:MAG: DUF2726 domain-containing protein [Thalassotalea sp.]
MELILFAMISLVVVVALLASKLNDNSFPFPFDRKGAIFTPAEKNFQNLVEQALGSKYRILNRVKLSDIVTIRNGVSSKAGQSATTNADNKYLDFVICDRDSMQLLGTIDLVDTQGKGYKMKKDWFVSGALEAASIPHVRIKIKPNYSVDEIKSCIHSRLFGEMPVSTPKIKGRVIPANMVKPRTKSNNSNVGVLTPTAARNALPANNSMAAKIPAPRVAALPH